MDIRKVKKLIELLEESGVSEIEIREGEESVRISRHAPQIIHSQAPSYPSPPTAKLPSTEAPITTAPAEASLPAGHSVTAPMVGTFYRSQSPGSPPFVEIGQIVKTGQVLCIIEAMKMLNQIESECAGKITRILVENGNPVEFNQPLFIISEE